MIIRLIPRVCDGLTDKSKCKELLTYCNENDSTELCNVKLVTRAIINPDNFTDVGHMGKAVYKVGASSIDDIQHSFINNMATIEIKSSIWYDHATTPVVKIAAHGIEAVGFVVDLFM